MEAGVSVCVHVPKHNLELAASAAGGFVLASMDVLSVAHAQQMTHVVGVAQEWKVSSAHSHYLTVFVSDCTERQPLETWPNTPTPCQYGH